MPVLVWNDESVSQLLKYRFVDKMNYDQCAFLLNHHNSTNYFTREKCNRKIKLLRSSGLLKKFKKGELKK